MAAPELHHPTSTSPDARNGIGKLDDPTAESVNKHLESCPPCRSRVAELTSDSFLGRLRDAQARPDSHAHLISSTAGLSMLDGGPGSPTASGQHAVPRDWLTTPTMRLFASSAGAAWESSIWPTTGSWDGWRCSRSSAAT